MNKIIQTANGKGNIQAGGDVLINPVFNIINVSLTDVKTFYKVLPTITEEEFISDVIHHYFKLRGMEPDKQLMFLEGLVEQQTNHLKVV